MQYYYENDLYMVKTELTEVTHKVIRLTDANSAILDTEVDMLTISDVYNMSNHLHNHAYLHQHISVSATTKQYLNWDKISEFTCDLKLLRDHFDAHLFFM